MSNRQHTPPLAAVRLVNTCLMLRDRANKRLIPDVAAQHSTSTIDRLRELTASGDFAYFMAGLPLPGPSAIRWTESEEHVRSAWRRMVQARQEHLRTGA
ncbi:hypothetical protein [Streptomyces sp. WMMC940]|uniref:hypothetical protein n=1 Tax=Streptomyces sp. WMMC940 TaxID=3015153 RepID=UPI0022B7411A|nr:hypothetical protein [Streptomyces sp. WMMC940]MCZ7456129.1 hypothetical protein [Streptomyces sp. WMMC940]